MSENVLLLVAVYLFCIWVLVFWVYSRPVIAGKPFQAINLEIIDICLLDKNVLLHIPGGCLKKSIGVWLHISEKLKQLLHSNKLYSILEGLT